MGNRNEGELMRAYSRAVFTVEIRIVPDECPDLDHLGRYSDTPEEGAIDRQARGEQDHHTFRYFNPPKYEDAKNRQQRRAYQFADSRRVEAYNRGDWASVGIVARVLLDEPGKAYPREVGSASCWGYESDAPEYLKESGRELAREAISNARENIKRAADALKGGK